MGMGGLQPRPFTALIAQQQGQRIAITNEIASRAARCRSLPNASGPSPPGLHAQVHRRPLRGRAAHPIQVDRLLWDDLLAELGARDNQLDLPPNPTHKESREDFNYVLHHHPEFVIDPGCTGLIFDLERVEVDADLPSSRATVAKRPNVRTSRLRPLRGKYLPFAVD